jgi:hypothetical protein
MRRHLYLSGGATTIKSRAGYWGIANLFWH